jgi:hypothetical protein
VDNPLPGRNRKRGSHCSERTKLGSLMITLGIRCKRLQRQCIWCAPFDSRQASR